MSMETPQSEQYARILLVDDDVQLVQGLALALQNTGYEVRAVERGTKVLDAISQYQPHLVVLDVMMPDLDGWEVLRRIRANQSTGTLPVIMLTAKDSEESKVAGFSLGADDYITKPFGLLELRCRIAALLRRSSTAHQEQCQEVTLPVVFQGSGHEFIRAQDVYFIEGIRNYTYVHTYDGRFLSRTSLGGLETACPERLLRVHRSYIVHLDHVRGCFWSTHSSFRLRLADLAETEIPVSRTLAAEVRRRLGVGGDSHPQS